MCENNHQRGFTLIEIVISMLIFAIISLIAYNALQTYSTYQKLGFEHFEKINALQNTSLFMKRDINQVFNQEIELHNNVLTIQSLQNDEILHIRYRLEDNNLVREDGTDSDNLVVSTLVKNIDKFSLKVLPNNTKGKWTKKYNKQKNIYIKAVEMVFENDYWGEITQWVMVGE